MNNLSLGYWNQDSEYAENHDCIFPKTGSTPLIEHLSKHLKILLKHNVSGIAIINSAGLRDRHVVDDIV
jgi:hypothetical protein